MRGRPILTCPQCGTPWHPETWAERRKAELESNVQEIFEKAYELWKVSKAELASPNRRPRAVVPRYWVMLQLRGQGLMLKEIGALLNRDHSTVLHGIRAAESKRYQGFFARVDAPLVYPEVNI